MPIAKFETPDEDEIEIDSEEVADIKRGPEEEATVVELADGDEIIVVASLLEVISELELDPSEYIASELDDEDPEEGEEEEPQL